MSASNHQEVVLVQTVLAYLACDLVKPDPRRIRSFGVRPDQIERISQLTTSDMIRIAALGAECVRIDVDPDVLDGVFAAIDQNANQTSVILDCLRLDAPREMMVDLFGVTHKQHARMRETLGLAPVLGRPRDISVEEAERVFLAWEAKGWAQDVNTLLALARELDLSLRTIWSEIASHTVARGLHPPARPTSEA